MGESTDEDRWSMLASELGLNEAKKDDRAPEPSGEDGAPKRRRRRRLRKPESEDPNSTEPTEGGADIIDPGETLEPADDDLNSDKPKKRRRRRGRKKSDDTARSPSSSDVGAEVIEDDELSEPVSVANLPSWQELIDGLHRP